MSTENFDVIDAIKAAAIQHPAKYTLSYALTICWESDDTNAHIDTDRFQSILATLQLPMADEIVIRAEDKTPGWTIQTAIQEILGLASWTTQERTLVIVHYAGHGYNSTPDKQYFIAYGSADAPDFNAERFLISHALPDEYDLQGTTNVDVLFILDTCYAISAQDPVSHWARQNSDDTLTSQLLREILDRKKKGDKYIKFADIVGGLSPPSALVEPKHGFKMGDASICLPFTGLSTPSKIEPLARVAMSVEISDNAPEEGQVQFLNWIRDMPDEVALTFNKVHLSSDRSEDDISTPSKNKEDIIPPQACPVVDAPLPHHLVCIRPCSSSHPPIQKARHPPYICS